MIIGRIHSWTLICAGDLSWKELERMQISNNKDYFMSVKTCDPTRILATLTEVTLGLLYQKLDALRA